MALRLPVLKPQPKGGEAIEGDLPGRTLDLDVWRKALTVDYQFPETATTPESELEKIAKTRKMLGLPEKSPLLETAKISKERKCLVDEYVEKETSALLEIEGGFIERGIKLKEEEKQEAEAYLKKMNVLERRKRDAVVFLMKARGVADAESLVSVLEKAESRFNYFALQDRRVLENLRGLDQEVLRLGLERVMTFGYPTRDYYFRSPNFVRALKIFARMPEADFQRLGEQLNQYFFLYNDFSAVDFSTGEISGNFQVLTEIIAAGGLTEQQQRHLERVKRQIVLNDNAFIRSKGGLELRRYHIGLGEALRPGVTSKTSDKFIFLMEDCAYRHLSGQEEKGRTELPTMQSLPRITENGLLPYVVELAEKGIDCHQIYHDLRFPLSEKELDRIQANLTRAYQFASDPVRLEWAALFQELRGQGLYDYYVYDSDTYEQMYQQRENLANLAIFLHALPKEVNLRLDNMVNFEQRSIEIKTYLIEGVFQALSSQDLPAQVQAFIRAGRQIFYAVHNPSAPGAVPEAAKKSFSLLAYLAQNKDTLSEVISDQETLRPKVIEEMLKGNIPVSAGEINFWYGKTNENERLNPELALQYIDVFQPLYQAMILRGIPIDIIQSAQFLSDNKRQLLFKAKELPVGLDQFLLEREERFAEFFVDGKVTPLFCDEVARTGSARSVDWLVDYLSEKTLALFPNKERRFWSFWKKQDGEVIRWIVDQAKESFYQLLDEGKPTPLFFQLLSQSPGFYAQTAGLLTDEVLATPSFSVSERAFWSVWRELPGEAKTFFLRQKDNFGQLVSPEGVFLPSFFAEAARAGAYRGAERLLTDDVLAVFPEDEKTFWRFWREFPDDVKRFVFQEKDQFLSFISPDGHLKPTFFETATMAGVSAGLNNLLTDEVIGFFPLKEQPFWRFFRGKNADFQLFLIGKTRDAYLTKEGLAGNQAIRDFMDEIRARPENCRTYESLTELFTELEQNRSSYTGEELGMMYIRIAEAHRIRTIGERTQVEQIVNLRQTFSALYHPNMTSFEHLAWKVLQRQLPFTANEQARVNMRNQADQVIEPLDERNRLAWIHQSVHNYASINEVAYLKAFKRYLETGKKEELERYRVMFEGEARSPDYTETDRQELLAISRLIPELDRLIELTSLFYDIRPETLETELAAVRSFFSDRGETKTLPLLTSFVEDIRTLATGQLITSPREKEAALHFCLNVNRVRRQIVSLANSEGINLEQKARLLVIDTVLDDSSQGIFTKYKDYLEQRKDRLTKEETFESVTVLGEVVKAGCINGELPGEVLAEARKFTLFAHPDNLTPEILHSTRLLLPIIEKQIDAYWGRFSAVVQPEMIQMLMRAGLSEQKATQRVVMTDIVEFRKSSTAYVLEPLLQTVKGQLEEIAKDYKGVVLSLKAELNRVLGGQLLEIGFYDNPEVASFLDQLSHQTMPDDITKAKAFLDKLSEREETQADKLARALIKGYMDTDKLQRRYTRIERGGKIIELYPFSYYGCDMAVVLVDGKKIDNPKEFFLSHFSVPKVILHSLREGD